MNPVITAAPAKGKQNAPPPEADLDRFADRIAASLTKKPGRFCARIDEFCARIDELLAQAERRRRL